jgi:hypothetical protein
MFLDVGTLVAPVLQMSGGEVYVREVLISARLLILFTVVVINIVLYIYIVNFVTYDFQLVRGKVVSTYNLINNMGYRNKMGSFQDG